MNKKKSIIGWLIVLGIVCITGASSLFYNSIYATEYEESTDGGGGSPGCYKYKRTHGLIDARSSYDDTCFGGVWWEYPVNGSDHIVIPNWGSVDGGSLDNCASIGADKYYRLALVQYNIIGENVNSPSSLSSSNYSFRWLANGAPDQKGLWKVKWFTISGISGGYTVYRSEGLDWNEVQRKREIAVQHNTNAANAANWGEVSMFCYSDSWENPTSNYDAWSWVDELSTADLGPDKDVTKTIVTQDDEVTVNFKHQFSYNAPSTAGTYGPANTKWRVEVRQDGVWIGGTAEEEFSPEHTGPERTSIWQEMPYMGQSTYTIRVPENNGDSTEVCSIISYIPKNIVWEANPAGSQNFVMDNDSSNTWARSSACVVVKRGGEETVVEDVGQIRFVSRSGVKATGDSGIQRQGVSFDEGNDSVTLHIATTKDYLDVDFWHDMRYLYEAANGSTVDPISIPPDRFENASYITTEWTVNRSSEDRTEQEANKEVAHGTKSVDQNSINGVSFSKVNGDNRYTIRNIDYGETVEVCERITFYNAIFPLEREEVMKRVPAYSRASTNEGQTLYRYNEITETYYRASSSSIYHEEYVSGTWQLRQGRGEYGDFIYGPGYEDLYEIAYIPLGEYVGQTVYTREWDDEHFIYVYTPTTYSDSETLYEQDYELVHDYWIYRPIEGADYGDGWSEACISVTRPEDPTKPGEPDPNGGPVSGPVSGSTDGGFIYAGETDSDVSWSTAAISYSTRRVMQARAIVYEPIVNVQAYNGISKGNLWDVNMHTNHIDPCAWYQNKIGAGNLRGSCVVVNEVGGSWSNGYDAPYTDSSPIKFHILNRSISAIVPNYVGDKYCNSFGYELAYWWGVTHSANSDHDTWAQDGQSYWAIYDAACRTIVKKPSLNLWNGSLFTNGDVFTTIANRYSNPILGTTVANPGASGSRSRFGSWSEYLAVIGGTVNSRGGFGSGTALSYNGLFSAGSLLRDISPLTISNVGPDYGQSGVIAGSTFRDRLSTYLGQYTSDAHNGINYTTNLDEVYQRNNPSGVANAVVVNLTGSNVEITDDIVVANGPYASVYQLPQILIFADNINIKSNVTRIDAWLVAKNGINTCSEFISGVGRTPSSHTESDAGTEAHIAGYNADATCSKQLTVNGPMIAGSIKLNRSHGADPLTDTNVVNLGAGTDARAIPGEIFNLSANSYLWAYAQAGRYDSSYTEAYTRELPPRY